MNIIDDYLKDHNLNAESYEIVSRDMFGQLKDEATEDTAHVPTR